MKIHNKNTAKLTESYCASGEINHKAFLFVQITKRMSVKRRRKETYINCNND